MVCYLSIFTFLSQSSPANQEPTCMKISLKFLILLLSVSTVSHAQTIEEEYIQKWKNFYPSKALAQGMHSSIFQYEDRSSESIQSWLDFNKQTSTQLVSDLTKDKVPNRIDLRLLKVQVQREIDQWEKEFPQANSISLYTSLISNALRKVSEVDFLTTSEKTQIVCQRLSSIINLSSDAKKALVSDTKSEAERSVARLQSTADFIENDLSEMHANWNQCADFEELRKDAAQSIRLLISHIQTELLPKAKSDKNLLGREEYARRLALYTDSNLTPEELAEIALAEIKTVVKLMGEVSVAYQAETYPDRTVDKLAKSAINLALADMQKDVPENGADYLQFWQELSEAAVSFLTDQKIATLPKNQTLRILPAPESAGAAARIGWVDSAPPFEPNPLTTLYLPSIPETLPKQEQIDFWASFNKPFNRIIVIHELFPGHYMQMKISKESPHPIRLLFPYGIYTEGWATFCERVALDNGWEKGNHLSMLAHLRKRLENANRAYTSMQVHCNNWNQEQVMDFSTNISLVAPQFAKSLWGRIMRSPMQLTSYFLGGTQFTELLTSERNRLGNQFDLKYFMDTIMKAGPIPIDEFPGIFNPTAAK